MATRSAGRAGRAAKTAGKVVESDQAIDQFVATPTVLQSHHPADRDQGLLGEHRESGFERDAGRPLQPPPHRGDIDRRRGVQIRRVARPPRPNGFRHIDNRK